MSSRAPGGRSTLTWLLPLLGVLLILALAAYLYWRQQAPRPAPAPPPSVQGTDWEIAFTTPIVPDDASKHTGGLDTKLVALMDRATRTLDVADYDFDLADVSDAMVRAAKRGVKVRMVTDAETPGNTKDASIQAAFKKLRDASIPIVMDPASRSALMHNKFTVVDGEWVQTGSWNYTDGDTYRLNNNQVIFHSRDLADNYTAEFEKMFTQKKFGASKPKGVPHPSLEIGGMPIENYFAAEDGVAAKLVERLTQAQHKIHFLAFSFTHDAMGQAMVAKRRAGLEVQGVFETTGSNTQYSEYPKMKQAGLDVYQDGNPYVMHHKVILLDDHITIFGSFNFSNNADQDNDENLLIVDNATFTAQFEQEFQRVLAAAKNPPARKQPTSTSDRTERQP